MKAWSCCGNDSANTDYKRSTTVDAPTSNARERPSCIGHFLHLTDLESGRGLCLRIIVAVLYLSVSVGTIFLCRHFGKQLHLVFWLGYWPQVTLLVLMFAVAVSFLLMTRVRINRYYRFQDVRIDPHPGKMKRNCSTQIGRLQSMVVFSAIVSLIVTGLGWVTVIRGLGMASTFLNACTADSTADPKVSKMQQTSDDLVNFQKQCRKTEGKNTVSIVDCPGFEKRFLHQVPDNVYVSYLLHLEKFDGCTGFCNSADPLHFSGRGQVKKHTCGEATGQQLWTATLLVAGPSIVAGLVMAVLAFILLEYEYL